jgi:hypothetical protein
MELSDLHLYLTSEFVAVVHFGPSFLYKFLVTALQLIARCHGGIPPSVTI